METKASLSRIGSYSFISALVFYAAVHDQLLSRFSTNPPWAKFVIEFLATFGIYTIVFEIFFWLYSNYFYRFFKRGRVMDGTWYQIFIINQYKNPEDAIRHGPCKIVSTYDGVSISGENYRTNREFRSSWQSELANVSGDNLLIVFKAEGIHQKSYITRGVISFHIYGSPPKKLIGSFSDSTPALHSGPMTLFRDKREYKKHLNHLIKMAKVKRNTLMISKEFDVITPIKNKN